ncbi:VOC family protein [Acinetobacter sp. V91_7]|uniref:VOC family protein n=1 Tax=unclassified Acinetobacter TaxID=196816 RepID=UPI00287CE978|nr:MULTISPECIES: VOC family protein [unclassified Acinetobacter]MDS7927934.1 VOC family protein [Acinetobacter sp. V102_4]MDS7932899.1 VOC family protein [Acinetobacter sp. V91_4B]MDS7961840.1 VOC family protein [Acinetobacter sp. V91_7]MDS8028913.1 VOC family protein [Acinetobacter sp. V91_13]
MSNPISWFEIYVNNIQRARIFYETVFKIKLTDFYNPLISNEIQMKHFPFDMHGYGSTGALVQRNDIPAGGNSSIVYFCSENCEIEEMRIEESGGKIYQTKTSIGEHGFTVLAIDTEGNLFGIHSMK